MTRPPRGDSYGAVLGLIIIGVSAILIESFGSLAPLWRSSDPKPAESGRCAYAVKVDGEPAGAVVLDEPGSLESVFARVGLSSRVGSDHLNDILPCSACICLSRDGSVTIARIGGAQLLCLGQRIDLNSADEQDLCALPGVGPTMARRILERRVARGGYSEVSQLLEVRGLGKRKLSTISRYIEASPNSRFPASH